MSIIRYTASIDTTITNAFKENLTTRGTGSNMGASGVLETFSIYAQATTSSVELTRFLIQFPLAQLQSDRSGSVIPGSGDVTWKLKLYNASHAETLPSSYTLQVSAVSASWQEGTGLDMNEYEDLTEDGEGSSWINANGNRTKATATITAATPGSLNSSATFTLTNVAGTTTTYRINGGGAYGTQAGGTAGSTIDMFIGGASTVAHIAEAVTKVINATTSGDMTAEDDGTDVTVTQGTTGLGGNTTSVDNSSGLASVGSFSGGDGQWSSIGGDYNSTIVKTQEFDGGLENLDIDVSDIVEKWLLDSNPWPNYGLGVRLTNAYEGYFSSSTGADTTTEIHNTSGAKKSYYTKKFFGRNTEFFYKRPVLEAQFNDTKKDDRGNFMLSSSTLPAADNLNKLYLYNYVRGRLVDIAGDNSATISMSLYHSSGSTPTGSAKTFKNASSDTGVTTLNATRESKGVYYVNIHAEDSTVSTTYPNLIDVWTYSGTEFFTGSAFTPKTHTPYQAKSEIAYVMSMPNLKKEYRKDQTARMRVYARKKNWSPNIYTTAKNKPENLTITSGSYRILRIVDDLEVVSYGTGSVKYSELSYDVSGNYFDISMKLLEPGYQYGIKFSIYDDFVDTYTEQPYLFKFRVVK